MSVIVEADSYRTTMRDQGFRRIVIKAYDHRCALCGVRIVTPDGHTVVDAAHIVRWSKSQNDDIRNGMALCKLCHWAFDEGMMGVTDHYNVITSRLIGLNFNAPGFLLTLAGPDVTKSATTPALGREAQSRHLSTGEAGVLAGAERRYWAGHGVRCPSSRAARRGQ